MSEWTPELKAKVIAKYKEGEPTPENSTDLIKEIADELDLSPNGVRMVLVQSGDYVKKTPTAGGSSGGGKETTGTKRVSKDSQLASLRNAITALGAEVDEDILGKLTGKAAAYFTSVLTKK